MKYYDAFSESGFHSAFLTSFVFDGQAFEDIVLPRLWNAGCRNLHVLVDETMLNRHLELFDPPRHAGLKYHLIKVKRPGAFHPKLVVQLGRNKARLMAGSANLTTPGLAGNLELVSTLRADREDIGCAQIINAALDYISQSVAFRDEWFRSGVARAKRRSLWLADAGSQDQLNTPELGTVAFIHDRRLENCLAQFVSLVGDDPITDLTIVSPYWDKRLEALKRLQSQLKDPKTQLVLDEERQLFPTAAIKQSDRVSFHSASELAGSRRLHGKLFIARGKQHDHILSGSFNCSAPALFSSSQDTRNAEAGIYRRIEKGTAITRLGLGECLAREIEYSDLPEFLDLAENETEIIAARDGGRLVRSQFRLVWHPPSGSISSGHTLLLFGPDNSGVGEAVSVKLGEMGDNQSFAIELQDSSQSACFGRVVFEDGMKSAPIPITNPGTLQVSSREVATGKIAKQLAVLNDFHAEGLGIIEILIELDELSSDDNSTAQLARRGSQRLSRDTKDESYPVLTYASFIAGRDHQSKTASHSAGIAFEDMYSADVRQTLNRLLGMINTSQNTGPVEDEDTQDLGPSEPQHEDDVESLNAFPDKTGVKSEQFQRSGHRQLIKHTRGQLTEGVAKFEVIMKERLNKPITARDIVHIRALLQTVLAFAAPISGASQIQHVLPSHEGSPADWPRLLGKIIQSVFTRGLAPFASLEVPTEMTHSPDVVLECWAAMASAMKLSGEVLTRTSPASPTAKAIAHLDEKIRSQMSIEITGKAEAEARYNDIKQAFDSRFSYLLTI